jgi:glycosyltransferase involved in cell wall biosynthesis
LSTRDTSNGTDTKSKKPNVAIMTHPFLARVGKTPLDNMIAVARPLANNLTIIAGGDYTPSRRDIRKIRIKATRRTGFFPRVLEQLLVHVRVLSLLFRLRKQINILIFFLGTAFPVPLVFAQALDIECFVVLAAMGSGMQIESVKESGAQWQLGELTRLRLSAALERVSYYFADKLIVYSPCVIDVVGLRKYRRKTIIAHRHFLDFDRYRFKDNIESRQPIIGFIGRLTEDKGILNFIRAIPDMLSVRSEVTFLVIGEGYLREKICEYLHEHDLSEKVTLTGFIPHDELPGYLTRLKLLVLPSYNEGLPNVMLEAMACGTPILVTPVGCVPDVLEDKHTGFIMHDNSPSQLAEAVIQTLNYPDLTRIVTNARALVENEFRYEKVVATWENIISCTNDR